MGLEMASDDRSLGPAQHALAGALSGAVTRAAIAPLDFLKIRYQLQIVEVRFVLRP